MGLLTKRRTILGLPIGRQKIAWPRIAMLGATAATAAAGQAGRKKVKQTSDQLRGPIEQGKNALNKASEIGDDVSGMTDRFSGNGGGGGGLMGRVASLIPGVGGGGGKGGGEGDYTKKLRLVIKEHQDVAVPRTVAYNQWTQYPGFPEWSKAVQSVDPDDEVNQKWTVKVGPSRRTFSAEVQEQVPDERIEWKASGGAEHFGVVTFHEFDENLTRVQIEMEYHPSGFIEKVGNIFLAARMRVRKDLRLFKHYMELENEETGSWRGEIADGEVAEQDEAAEQEQEEGGGSEEQEQRAEGNGDARAQAREGDRTTVD